MPSQRLLNIGVAVIAGLQLFSFIGHVFGPLLISMFLLLLCLYGSEFLIKRHETNRVK